MKHVALSAFLLLALVLMIGIVSWGDTGTYKILNYKVSLSPRSDGTVDMHYYQKWLVTGGHIPWITVGTPNDDFTIVGYSGAVSRVSSASQGGWTGVRLDLDRDYRDGQVFEVSFEIIDRDLFYADQQDFRLDFTPGWYDRAITDTLRISVKFFAKLETVKAKPEPSGTSEQEMTWIRNGLGEGERFSISVSFPRRLFPGVSGQQSPIEARRRGPGVSRGDGIVVFVILFIIFPIVILVVLVISPTSYRRRYSGGRIFYGGWFGGIFGRGAGGSGRSTGGGGGFGGSSFSCACACVSCACACACAGGGGAGCSKKLHHSCPHCEPERFL